MDVWIWDPNRGNRAAALASRRSNRACLSAHLLVEFRAVMPLTTGDTAAEHPVIAAPVGPEKGLYPREYRKRPGACQEESHLDHVHSPAPVPPGTPGCGVPLLYCHRPRPPPSRPQARPASDLDRSPPPQRPARTLHSGERSTRLAARPRCPPRVAGRPHGARAAGLRPPSRRGGPRAPRATPSSASSSAASSAMRLGATQKPPAYSIAVGGALGGGVAGWLRRQQYDELHRAQFRGVRPLTPRSIGNRARRRAERDRRERLRSSPSAAPRGVQLFLLASEPRARGGARRRAHRHRHARRRPAQRMAQRSARRTASIVFPPRRGRGVLVRRGEHRGRGRRPTGRIFWASGDRSASRP